MPDVRSGDLVKALLIGDIHLSVRPPSLRHSTYVDEILDKVAWCVQLAASRKVDVIISAGDVFHVKSPSRTTHGLVQRTHEVLTAADIPVLVVPGNHDMQHDRLDSLDSQPLGALCRMRGIEMLIGGHESLPVFGLPYLQNWADDLYGWMAQWQEFADKHWLGQDEFPLLVTHAPIFPSDEDPPYETIDAADWAELMGNKGAVYHGHIHTPSGFYVEGGVWLANMGALSRGSLHESSLKRTPAVTLYDSERSLGLQHMLESRASAGSLPDPATRMVMDSSGMVRAFPTDAVVSCEPTGSPLQFTLDVIWEKDSSHATTATIRLASGQTISLKELIETTSKTNSLKDGTATPPGHTASTDTSSLLKTLTSDLMARGGHVVHVIEKPTSDGVWHGPFQRVEVPHLPAEEVFSLAAKAESDGAQQKLTDFLTGLDAVQAESVEQVSHHIATLDVDKEVRTKAIELVEAAMGVHA